MEFICVVECDDCGKSIIREPAKVQIFVHSDGDLVGVAKCTHCEEFVFADLAQKDAIEICSKGVKVFSFETGEEIPVIK